MSQEQEQVKCTSCGLSILKTVAIEKDGKYYCCPDCASGKKPCDCQ